MRSICSLLSVVTLFLVLTLFAVPQVSAQETILDNLIITSTGLKTPKNTHPGTVSNLSRQEVDFVRADHIAELLNRLPGLNVHRNNGQENLVSIRSPVLTGGAGAGSFLYLEDGIPLRAAGFANVNGLMEALSENAAGLEVIRGPASARFGSNAVHGLINFLSPAPQKGRQIQLDSSTGPHGLFDLRANASYGQENGQRFQGAHISTAFLEDGGFRANSGFSQQKFQLRYDNTGGRSDMYATLSGYNLNQETAGFVEGDNAFRDDALRKTNPDPEAFRDAWAWRAAVHTKHTFDNATHLIITPYARQTRMKFRLHFLPGQAIEENGHWSIGIQNALHLPLSGGHKLVIGMDGEYSAGYLRETQTNPSVFSFIQGEHYNYTVDALVLAPYLHGVWKAGVDTQITTGIRLEHTRYDYDNILHNNIFGRFQRTPDRSDSFTDITPKLGITHNFGKNLTGFAHIARAARAPQTTDLYRLQSKQVPAEIKSEELDSIEAGIRGTLPFSFPGPLVYEVAVYAMKKKNFFFRDSDGLNVPDGRTRHYGLEIEATIPLAAGFSLAGSMSYAAHRYAFNRKVASASNTIRSGAMIDTAPRTLSNIRLDYTFSQGKGRGELEWVHTGKYYTNPANTKEYGGHNLVNLRGSFALSEKWSVFTRLTNVFDTRYAERADFAFGNPRFFPGEDRSLHIGFSGSF